MKKEHKIYQVTTEDKKKILQGCKELIKEYSTNSTEYSKIEKYIEFLEGEIDEIKNNNR